MPKLPWNVHIRPIDLGGSTKRYVVRRSRSVPVGCPADDGPGKVVGQRGDAATGPAPGPPPPWGVEKVLCRLSA